MAYSPPPLALALAALLALFSAARPAASATASSPNINTILVNGTNYKTFIRMLHETQVDIQINNELEDSANTFTVFAPTDNAFQSLKPGLLNTLTQQEQVELVMYHFLPHYYSLATFQTASNPVRTEASGNHGAYTLNVTTDNSLHVNISTGIMETPIASTLFDNSVQLSVFSVEKVLEPYDLFGPKPPAPPSPPPSKTPDSAAAAAPKAGENSAAAGSREGWRLAAGVGLAAIAAAGSLL